MTHAEKATVDPDEVERLAAEILDSWNLNAPARERLWAQARRQASVRLARAAALAATDHDEGEEQHQ